jgi:lysine-specific demethylase 3
LEADTCRFQHIRSFLRDGDRNLVGFIFQEQQQQRDLPTMRYPTAWNVPLEKSYIDMTKVRAPESTRPGR